MFHKTQHVQHHEIFTKGLNEDGYITTKVGVLNEFPWGDIEVDSDLLRTQVQCVSTRTSQKDRDAATKTILHSNLHVVSACGSRMKWNEKSTASKMSVKFTSTSSDLLSNLFSGFGDLLKIIYYRQDEDHWAFSYVSEHCLSKYCVKGQLKLWHDIHYCWIPLQRRSDILQLCLWEQNNWDPQFEVALFCQHWKLSW